MAGRRDDERRFRGERRDPETERRIDRLADRYRGSDERAYGGGERPGRDWEREARGEWRASPSGSFHEEPRDERDRPWGYGDRTPHTSTPYDVERWGTGFSQVPRHGGPGHSDLIGLYDMDDLSELRERYRESRRGRDHAPHYGHGPGVENMEPPRLGYSTSTGRRDYEDRELGHGGMLGPYRTGAQRPMGRGPKGYQRSDDRIREDICERLMTSPYDASDVEVTVSQGEVTLTGTVQIRADKWGIEDVADSALGVQDVHNQIRINRGEAQTPTTLAGDTGNLHS